MKRLKYAEIRKLYLDYMAKNNHAVIPGANLVPLNDPTVLYVNSGMFPLVPFLSGEADHPQGTRLANSQRAVRTVDIEEVGDNTHLTVFEMLGNWSVNDYFKEEAIDLTVGFFEGELGVDFKNVYVSVFEGDDSVPRDEVSIKKWTEIFEARGIEPTVGVQDRIQPLDRGENWWGLPGGGPCGPCSEIFLDTGIESCGPDCNVACDCEKYVELGNNVFMEYMNTGDDVKPLGKHNVDFGGGLARLTMISQGVDNVYDTDMMQPIVAKIHELADESKVNEDSVRIIADHIRAAIAIIMDGVIPGRTEREYILRRIIRRAIRHAKKIGIDQQFTTELGSVVVEQMIDVWTDLQTRGDQVIEILTEEEIKFNKTLENGLREFDKQFTGKEGEVFTNEDGFTFKMFETYGFPIEVLLEELDSRSIEYDLEKVNAKHEEAYKSHQEQSRSAAAGMFKGGLADTSESSTYLHTATHLLLAALYEVVGDHICQKGSNITPERLRLDFPNDVKLTPEQLEQVENLVNEQIEANLPISFVEMDKDEALDLVNYTSFADRYGDVVKVYYMGEGDDAFSVEICNGPHAESTGVIGKFKIKKQENVSAGIKRIKAVLER